MILSMFNAKYLVPYFCFACIMDLLICRTGFISLGIFYKHSNNKILLILMHFSFKKN